MGNGHAPGTATGLSAADVGTAVIGFGAECSWEADLAVFFFAAFLMAGFLAGLFLASVFFAGPLRLAPDFLAAGADDFRETPAPGFFLRADALRITFFLDIFFFAAVFVAFAIRASAFSIQVNLLRRYV